MLSEACDGSIFLIHVPCQRDGRRLAAYFTGSILLACWVELSDKQTFWIGRRKFWLNVCSAKAGVTDFTEAYE